MRDLKALERRSSPEFDTAVRSLRSLRPCPCPSDDPSQIEPPTVLADVQQAVRAMAEGELRRVASTDAGLPFQPRFLLRLLVYCYATGIFSSAEIEDLMRRDPNFRGLCHGEFPSARVLKRFRRENRTMIRDGVCAVLQRQSQRLHPSEDGAARALWDALREEADGRLMKAMFIDRMEDEND